MTSLGGYSHRTTSDVRVHLSELEAKLKDVMIANAQLDNEKQLLR